MSLSVLFANTLLYDLVNGVFNLQSFYSKYVPCCVDNTKRFLFSFTPIPIQTTVIVNFLSTITLFLDVFLFDQHNPEKSIFVN